MQQFWRLQLVTACAPLFVAVFAVVGAREVRAAPDEPHGRVETCTVHWVQERTTDCEMCSVSSAAPRACSARFAPLGYQWKCRTAGNRAGWGEVWCIDQSALAPPSKWKLPLWVALGVSLLAGLVLLAKRVRASRTATK